jgi:hypothetical protein
LINLSDCEINTVRANEVAEDGENGCFIEYNLA